MANFVWLTEQHSGRTVIVNLDHVQSIKGSPAENCTLDLADGQHALHVVEGLDEIRTYIREMEGGAL